MVGGSFSYGTFSVCGFGLVGVSVLLLAYLTEGGMLYRGLKIHNSILYMIIIL